jgi:hypothetical protein
MSTVQNIFVDQGSDYSAVITVRGSNGQPLDLTGFTVESQIRKYYGSSGTHCFNGTIANAATGRVRITLPGSQSQEMQHGRYVYDVRVISPAGVPKRVIGGALELIPQATKGPCP